MSIWFCVFGLPLTQCLRGHVLYALVPFLSLSQQDSQHSAVICYLKLLSLAVLVGGRLDFYCSDKAYSSAFTIFLGLRIVAFSVPLPIPYSSSEYKPAPPPRAGFIFYYLPPLHLSLLLSAAMSVYQHTKTSRRWFCSIMEIEEKTHLEFMSFASRWLLFSSLNLHHKGYFLGSF